jgi:hypothetical protein
MVAMQSPDASEDPVLNEGAVLPVCWTEELLRNLDWKRLLEVVRALSVYSGYEPGTTAIEPTGAAQFFIEDPKARQKGRALVRLAPWSRWMATVDCVTAFVETLAAHGQIPGIYIAPAGSTPGAQTAARSRGIQLLDARLLAARLNELPQEYSEYFHDRTVSGVATVPTCPICLRPMTSAEEPDPGKVNVNDLPDLRYATQDIVGEPIHARRIEVLQSGEVHFLREVRAQDVVVNGVVKGDFVCDRSLLLNPGGVLYGSVAARSVLVRPGGALNGETRILQGPLEPIAKLARPWAWRCEHVPSQPGCEKVVFHPH